jgi:hypothetical protein
VAASSRPATKRGAVQLAALIVRAAGGQVHRRAVVPEHHVVRLPLVAIDVFRAGAQVEQLGQQRAALVLGQADDAGREMLADEQRLAARFRMRAPDRVHDGLDLVDLRLGQVRAPRIALLQVGVARQVAVLRLRTLDGALQVRRQAVPGRVLVGEQRVAADGRQLLRVQHRAQARRFLVRQVGMPQVAGVAQADRLAVFADVRNDQHLGLFGQLELAQHVDLQGAEAAAERHLLGGRDALVAEHQHVIIEMGAVDAREIGVAERLRQVEAHDLGAERGIEGADRKRLRAGSKSFFLTA